MAEETSTLRAMGEAYAREADVLDELIAACKERRRFALRSGRSDEALRQEELLQLHQQQRNDLRQIAVWLKNYYEHDEDETKGEVDFADDRSNIA